MKSKLSSIRIPAVTLLAACSLGLAGCSMSMTNSGPSALTVPAIEGKAMGGETPISGAAVILWQTDPANGGYGSSAAVKLGTTTSGSGGSFSFTTGYTCTAGQFVYVTATGGDVSNGGNMINNNSVQVAALGSCSNFSNAAAQANVHIVVNEISTVAAAYALGNFMTIVPNTPGNQLVYIGAPANNNATTGACTGTGSTMTCVAAGLSHAFSNALNLTDSVHFDGTFPGGGANITVPGNNLGSIPQAEINTLANILQTCTNTTGGVAGDSSACGNLFSVATPTGGTAPADELSAILDISKNPKHNVGSSTTTCGTATVFCLAPATGAAFLPQLTATPTDWSLAITYSGFYVSGTAANITYPEYVALDANDDVYIANTNVNTTAPLSTGISAMTSTGAGLWANPLSAQYCYSGALATDTVGNVWFANGPTTAEAIGGCWQGVTGFSMATGATSPNTTFSPGTPIDGSPNPGDSAHNINSQAMSIAIDNLNNVWYSRNSSSSSSGLYAEFAYTPGSPASYAAASNLSTTSGSDLDMFFDSNNNLFFASKVLFAYELPNTGTVDVPTYPSTGVISMTIPAAGTGLLAMDASGNLWAAQNAKISEIPAPFAAAEAASQTLTVVPASNPTGSGPSTPYPGEFDGNNILWYPSHTSSGQIWFSYFTGGTTGATITSDFIQTCYAPNGAATCAATGSSGVANTDEPRNLQIDSTGALWVATNFNNDIVQILGPAAPAWPQRSYGHFAVKPH